MMMRQRFSTRPIASAAVLALALGASACGDSDDDGSGGATPAQKPSTVAAKTPAVGGDEGQIRARFEALQAGFESKRPEAMCAQLTERAQRRTAAAGGADYDTCRKVAARLVESYSGIAATRRTKLEKVKLNGDRATATVKAGETTRLLVPFVKADGEWKIDQPING